MSGPTEKQIERLISASEDLAAHIAKDACRVVEEFSDDANLVPYLDSIPVRVAREFDEAIADIQRIMMGEGLPVADSMEQRRKYQEAMAELRASK